MPFKNANIINTLKQENKKLKSEVERLQSIASENQRISDGWREAHGKAMDRLEAEEEKNRKLKSEIERLREIIISEGRKWAEHHDRLEKKQYWKEFAKKAECLDVTNQINDLCRDDTNVVSHDEMTEGLEEG
jgi:hypothetical protein